MRLATWNVNSLGVRLPHLLAWLGEHQPDVLVLQEIKLTDDKDVFQKVYARLLAKRLVGETSVTLAE